MPSAFDSKTYYVYIMSSRSRNLYIGFTSEIEVRVLQHRNHSYSGHTSRYRCERLVYLERYDNPEAAISREKQLKRWRRAKKLALIKELNPTWLDLSESWGKPVPMYQWLEGES